MGLIPLGDATRRPVHTPAVTVGIIVVNVIVFILELIGGQAFVTKWSLIPANVSAGRDYITVLTSMFMHGSWSHILGNMVFLWAFGPEIEDSMGRGRYLIFYLIGGLAASLAQVLGNPTSTIPNLGASGAIAAVMGAFLVTYPRDRIRSILMIFVFVRVRYILPRAEDFEPCWPVLKKYFGEVRPAATMISAGLIDPRIKIEIEVTARRT